MKALDENGREIRQRKALDENGRGKGRIEMAGIRGCKAGRGLALLCIIAMLGTVSCGNEKELLQIEFYYENVCASCEGDADFYALYNRCISPEEKEGLQVETATYNVFMDSCRERYEERAERLGIPEGTSMPVLIIGDRWFAGYGEMEESLHRVLVEERGR